MLDSVHCRRRDIMQLPIAAEFFIGSATGLLDCVLFHWIDSLKVRRQDNRPLLMDVKTGLPLQRSAMGLPRFAAASVGSLYAGFSTNLSLKVPYMASMFAFSALNNRLLSAALDDHVATSDDGGSSSGGADGGGGEGSKAMMRDLASAALVGVEVSLLLAPLEMVRIQGQNNGKGGLIEASRAVAATAAGGGVGGWWRAWTRGMTATMHREAKYCVGQFFLCAKISEYVSAYMQRGNAGGEPLTTASSSSSSSSGASSGSSGAERATLSSQIAGGVLGGIACTVVSHPDDVVQTRPHASHAALHHAPHITHLRTPQRIALGALCPSVCPLCAVHPPVHALHTPPCVALIGEDTHADAPQGLPSAQHVQHLRRQPRAHSQD